MAVDFANSPVKISSETLFDVENFVKDFYQKISELNKIF